MLDKDDGIFIKKFFTQPKINAAICPTSNHSAKLLCKSIDRKEVTTVIELGPGTGALTEFIIQSMPEGASYCGIEYDEEYVGILKKKFENKSCTFIHGNVSNINEILDQNGVKKVDVVVSSLSNSVFKENANVLKLLEEYISTGTQLRTITYLPFLFLSLFKLMKPKIYDFTLLNIPPAFVGGSN